MSENQTVRIWTKDGFIEDRLTALNGAVLMSPEEATGKLSPGRDNVLVIEAGDEVGAVAGRVGEFCAVLLRLPVFSDGRAFSTARLLREKYAFIGMIRAEGHFILDQIPYMLRVGFDQFAVSHEPTITRLEAGQLPGVDLFYQPAYGTESRAGERAWARRAG